MMLRHATRRTPLSAARLSFDVQNAMIANHRRHDRGNHREISGGISSPPGTLAGGWAAGFSEALLAAAFAFDGLVTQAPIRLSSGKPASTTPMNEMTKKLRNKSMALKAAPLAWCRE